jgi:hypothetical protein
MQLLVFIIVLVYKISQTKHERPYARSVYIMKINGGGGGSPRLGIPPLGHPPACGPCKQPLIRKSRFSSATINNLLCDLFWHFIIW